MLNEKKIRLMTRLSMMEEDKEKFRIRDYFMGDYIRYQLLQTIIRVTIGYALVLLLAALYHAEMLINSTSTLDYTAIGEKAILIYLGLLAVFVIGSFVIHLMKYRRSQRYISKYEKGLGILHRFYQQNGPEQ